MLLKPIENENVELRKRGKRSSLLSTNSCERPAPERAAEELFVVVGYAEQVGDFASEFTASAAKLASDGDYEMLRGFGSRVVHGCCLEYV